MHPMSPEEAIDFMRTGELVGAREDGSRHVVSLTFASIDGEASASPRDPDTILHWGIGALGPVAGTGPAD